MQLFWMCEEIVVGINENEMPLLVAVGNDAVLTW